MWLDAFSESVEPRLTTVMEGFKPKPGTLNASGLFMGYVRSIQNAQSKGKGKGPLALAVPAPNASANMQEEVAKRLALASLHSF